MSRRLLLPLLGMLVAGPLLAQSQSGEEHGFPFITNFSPRDYGGQTQVWCALEDSRGIMLFCGSDGVLEYDGTTWRLTATPTGTTIRSMAMADDGTVYVGAVGDFGYLASDDQGNLEFKSLLDKVPEEFRTFVDVWETLVGPDGIYFTTTEHLYRWDGTQFKVWTADDQFHLAAFVDGQLFVRQWNVGLMKMEDEELTLVPGGERFAQERIYVFLPWDDGKILMGTRTQGLLLYDGKSFEPFKTEADDFLQTSLLYLPGLELRDGSLVLGTVYGGAVRIGHDGRLIQKLTKETGVINNAIYYVASDSNGDIWLTTDAGISRVEVGSPFTIFDDRAGLATQPYLVRRHNGRLFVGHQGGIYEMQGDHFVDLPGISEQMFDLLPVGDGLLGAGTQSGIFEVKNGVASLVVGGSGLRLSGWAFLPSSWDEDIVFVGISNGVVAIQRGERGSWSEIGRVDFIGNASTLVEDEPGTIWVGSLTNGVLRVTYPIKKGVPDLSEAEVTQFSEDDGLSDVAVLVYKVAGKNYFVSNDAIYTYDEVNHHFNRDDTFMFEAPPPGSQYFGQLVEMESGVVWVLLGNRVAYAVPQPDGSYSWVRKPFVRLDDSQVQFILPEKTGVTWFASLDGLIRYDGNLEEVERAPVSALIRKVTLGRDSVLYGGGPGDQVPPTLDYTQNEIHFEFSTPSFVVSSKNRYRTQLEGFDKDWSDWSPDARRAYTNLPPGDYRFLVRARNVEGVESPEAGFEFSILPPWYRTWWAYLLFALVFGGGVVGLVRLRTNQLQIRQRELEKTVEDRTAEIRDLLAQSDQRAAELATVNSIGTALTSQLEFDALVKLVGDQIRDTFNADVVYVALLDKNTGMINFPYGHGDEFKPMKYGQGLTSKIIDSKEPLLINEDTKRKHEEMGVEEVGVAAASYLGVPISERDEVVGVMSVQSTSEEGRFDEDDLRLLTTIASSVGIALQNAQSYQELSKTLQDLKSTQEQLVTQEKMASLGQLTAGIAHEIKNPLNFVNNFSELNTELAADLIRELEDNRDRKIDDVYDDLFDIATSLKTNASQISKHGKRADSIVKNMMQHASGGSTERFRVEVNAFVDEYVGLAYHGMRAQNPNLNVQIEKHFDDKAGNAEMSPQELGRVLLNLVNNALYAVNEKSSSTNGEYKPTVTVSTKRQAGQLEIRIQDNGTGIPETVKEHIFEPLFTTKPTGSGTGLGLSLAFDIVTQVHKGELRVESKEGEGSTFVVRIPA